MGRSGSRSPRRERRRSRSRSRERRAVLAARRSRSPEAGRRRRSRSPRRRSRTPDRDRERRFERRERTPEKESDAIKVPPPQLYQRPPLDPSAFEGKSPEEIEMMKVMGFGDFDTTKGKKVQGNQAGSVNIVHKRRYRQYMNRRGGFNRPLDSIA